MHKIFFLFIFAFSAVFSQYQIKELVYNPMRIQMNDVEIFSKDLAVAVGNSGYVRIIKDRASSYDYARLDEKYQLNAIAFINSKELICAGDNGNVFISQDSAKNWVSKETDINTNLNDVAVYDQETFFAAGNNGLIIKTTDGGENWYKVPSSVNDTLNSLAISSDKKYLYAVGKKGTVLRSTDEGESWAKLTVPSNVNFQQVIAKSDKTVYVSGDELTVLVSHDAGESFSKPVLSSNYNNLYRRPECRMHFFNENEGFVKVQDRWSSLPRHYEYYTDDGGESWTEVKLGGSIFGPAFAYSPKCFDFLDKDFGYVIDASGSDFKCKINNDRIVYTRLNIMFSYWFQDIASYENDTFAAVYDYGSPVEMVITTDAGFTWIKRDNFDTIGRDRGPVNFENIEFAGENTILLSMTNEQDSVYYTDSSKVTIYSFEGYVLRSTNLGETWSEFVVPNKESIGEIDMLDESYGVLRLWDTKYMVTKNGGVHWDYVELQDTSYDYIRDVFCPSIEHQVIVAEKGDSEFYLIETFDEGNNFEQPIKLPENNNFAAYKDGEIYAGAYEEISNNIYKHHLYQLDHSSNQWTEIFHTEEGENSFLRDLLVIDDSTMLALHGGGYVYHTNNKWEDHLKIKIPNLNSMEYLRNVVELGSNVFILHTSRDKLFKVIIDKESSVVVEQMAEPEINIYPNPATDRINIAFGETQANEIDIRLYNIQGTEVKNIQGHSITGGSIEIPLDNNLSQGMYFLKIETNDNIFVEKLIIK